MKFKFNLTLSFLISVFLLIINANILNASVLTQTKHDDIWLDSLTVGEYRGMTDKFTEYEIDGNTTYCVEPNVKITTDTYYGQIGYINSPYSEEINKKLQLIGYYGYGYPNHNTIRYKMATQALIWEVLRPQTFSFWTQANGTGDYIDISKERNDIMNLVNSHYTVPSFAKEVKNISIGESAIFTDTTGTLSKYEVYSSNNATSTINGNTLTITPNAVGTTTITLMMKDHTSRQTEFFIGSDSASQKMARFGLDDPLHFRVSVNVSGASLTIHKKDADTLTNTPKGNASLKGAVYELLDENRNHITYLTTDEDGTAKTDNILKLKTKYILVEKSSPTGYTKNPKEYEINTGDDLEVNIDVYEKVVEQKLNIFKVYASNETGFLTPEPNVQFDIYLKSTGELYTSIITDENGKATTILPYGEYRISQKTTSKDHYKVKDFNFSITKETDEEKNILLSNSEITAKLKVVKIDADTKKVIKRANIKFKILDTNTNEYVCQSIVYPNPNNVCEFETNKDGFLITPAPLKSGKYKLEEVNQSIDGYLWNNTSKEFIIGENSELITDSEYGIIFETRFENKPVKGSVEINKIGEELVKENDTYYYKEIPLDNVEYQLYADKDIFSADGTLIYSANELIGTYITKNGKIEINDMYLGSYYFIEKTTLENHVLDTSKHYFTLKYKDQLTPLVKLSFTYKNYLKKGKLEFTKTDVGGEPLPNTKISIYDANTDEKIFEEFTNENGKIIIDNLYVSKFYIIESEAPEGYILNPEKMYFEILENGEIIKSTMINEKVVEVPNTGLNDSKFIEIAGIILIVLGVGYLLYDKNKKK